MLADLRFRPQTHPPGPLPSNLRSELFRARLWEDEHWRPRFLALYRGAPLPFGSATCVADAPAGPVAAAVAELLSDGSVRIGAFVAPELRGRGIASALVARLESLALELASRPLTARASGAALPLVSRTWVRWTCVDWAAAPALFGDERH